MAFRMTLGLLTALIIQSCCAAALNKYRMSLPVESLRTIQHGTHRTKALGIALEATHM